MSLPPPNQFAFQRRLGVTLASPIVLLLILCSVFLALIDYLQTTARWVNQTDEVLAQANQIEKLLIDRETGLRGYLATGEQTFLEPYRQAQRTLGPAFDTLSQRIAEQPDQAARLAELRRLADEWDQYAQPLIALRGRGGVSTSAALHGQGKQQMDALRVGMTEFLVAETALRDQSSQTAARASDIVVGGSVLLSLGLGGLLALVSWRQLRGLARRYGQALANGQAHTAELLAIRRQNELLLNSIGEGIYGLDQQGRITFTNPAAARMVGWSPAELLGQPLHERLHHSTADGAPHPRERCPITTTLRDGTIQQVASEVFWRKDGTPIPVEYVSSPIADAGAITGAVVVCRDISERRRLEAQLIQAQKIDSIGRLAGGIAHDFNNLITTIAGCVELARDSLPEDHPAQEDLITVQDAAERATALTRQLLTFARKQAIAPRRFSLNDLLRGIDSLLRRTLGATITLDTHLAPDLGLTHADRTQIEQVLLNLAINARDAMPDGGTLTIETANVELDETYTQQHLRVLPGQYVMLAVSDTGQGMPLEVQEQIFEPFFSTKDDGRSTGLGLSTSYGIVQQHGGAIWVYSEVGRGATFKVYLPCAAPAAATLAQPDRATPAGTETLLLVDDQAPMRALATRILREQGYTVLEAATGEAGLRLAQTHTGQLDLLLADIVLPDRGGVALAEQIAALRPNIKILFVSGYPERALTQQGGLVLDRPVLHKPFAAAPLLRAVRVALDQ